MDSLANPSVAGFGIDVMKCPGCGSQMQRIAVIMQPKVIKAILDCLQAKQQPP